MTSKVVFVGNQSYLLFEFIYNFNNSNYLKGNIRLFIINYVIKTGSALLVNNTTLTNT